MKVAPLVGAWIEILNLLKNAAILVSLPLWERGLKYRLLTYIFRCDRVAPLVGAWIEIPIPRHLSQT